MKASNIMFLLAVQVVQPNSIKILKFKLSSPIVRNQTNIEYVTWGHSKHFFTEFIFLTMQRKSLLMCICSLRELQVHSKVSWRYTIKGTFERIPPKVR